MLLGSGSCGDAVAISDDGNVAVMSCPATPSGIDLFSRDIGSATTVSHGGADPAVAKPHVDIAGRFITFQRGFSRPGVLADIAIVDRVLGGAAVRVNFTLGGGDPNADSTVPAISGDGRYFAFLTTSTNYLVSDVNGAGQDVLVAPVSFSAPPNALERLSLDATDTQVAASTAVALSRDGRFAVFDTTAGQVLLRDRETGTSRLISLRNDGSPATNATSPGISADGRFVAFLSTDAGIVPGDANGRRDVFMIDTQTNVVERVSINDDDTEAATLTLVTTPPVLSGDGGLVAFLGRDVTTASGSTSTYSVIVRDRTTGATLLRSPGGGTVGGFAMTPSGRYVLYTTSSTPVPDDGGASTTDVFRYDALASTTVHASAGGTMLLGSGNCGDAVAINDDGNVAVMLCPAASGGTDLFSRDIGSAATVSHGGADPAVAKPHVDGQGRTVVFHRLGARAGTPFDVFKVERAIGVTTRINYTAAGTDPNASTTLPAISGDGSEVAFLTAATNYLASDANGSQLDALAMTTP